MSLQPSSPKRGLGGIRTGVRQPARGNHSNGLQHHPSPPQQQPQPRLVFRPKEKPDLPFNFVFVPEKYYLPSDYSYPYAEKSVSIPSMRKEDEPLLLIGESLDDALPPEDAGYMDDNRSNPSTGATGTPTVSSTEVPGSGGPGDHPPSGGSLPSRPQSSQGAGVQHQYVSGMPMMVSVSQNQPHLNRLGSFQDSSVGSLSSPSYIPSTYQIQSMVPPSSSAATAGSSSRTTTTASTLPQGLPSSPIAMANSGPTSIIYRLLVSYKHLKEKIAQLKDQEVKLSQQAGGHLSVMQREERKAAALAAIVQRVRQTRKHLLSRITSPRWEVPHHYHTTALEHSLGRKQPNVIEVGEMISGHLRIYAIARRTTLSQKILIYALNRAKKAKTSNQEKMTSLSAKLRTARSFIRDVEDLLRQVRKKSVDVLNIIVSEYGSVAMSQTGYVTCTLHQSQDSKGAGDSQDNTASEPIDMGTSTPATTTTSSSTAKPRTSGVHDNYPTSSNVPIAQLVGMVLHIDDYQRELLIQLANIVMHDNRYYGRGAQSRSELPQQSGAVQGDFRRRFLKSLHIAPDTTLDDATEDDAELLLTQDDQEAVYEMLRLVEKEIHTTPLHGNSVHHQFKPDNVINEAHLMSLAATPAVAPTSPPTLLPAAPTQITSSPEVLSADNIQSSGRSPQDDLPHRLTAVADGPHSPSSIISSDEEESLAHSASPPTLHAVMSTHEGALPQVGQKTPISPSKSKNSALSLLNQISAMPGPIQYDEDIDDEEKRILDSGATSDLEALLLHRAEVLKRLDHTNSSGKPGGDDPYTDEETITYYLSGGKRGKAPEEASDPSSTMINDGELDSSEHKESDGHYTPSGNKRLHKIATQPDSTHQHGSSLSRDQMLSHHKQADDDDGEAISIVELEKDISNLDTSTLGTDLLTQLRYQFFNQANTATTTPSVSGESSPQQQQQTPVAVPPPQQTTPLLVASNSSTREVKPIRLRSSSLPRQRVPQSTSSSFHGVSTDAPSSPTSTTATSPAAGESGDEKSPTTQPPRGHRQDHHPPRGGDQQASGNTTPLLTSPPPQSSMQSTTGAFSSGLTTNLAAQPVIPSSSSAASTTTPASTLQIFHGGSSIRGHSLGSKPKLSLGTMGKPLIVSYSGAGASRNQPATSTVANAAPSTDGGAGTVAAAAVSASTGDQQGTDPVSPTNSLDSASTK